MKGNLSKCLDIVFAKEGGYVDNPNDNGGSTNLGITIKTLRAWRQKPVTKEDVRNVTRAEAEKIYLHWYAQPVRFDDLPLGVDLVAFDAAVNSGPSQSAKWLQEAVGVKADGFIGLITLEAIGKADPVELINRACMLRMEFLKLHEDWPHFGKGWTNRVENIRKEAIAMARPIKETPPSFLQVIIDAILSLIRGRK